MSSIVPMMAPIWSERAPRLSTVLADSCTLSAICPMTLTVVSTTFAPFWAEADARCAPSDAIWQFWAMSPDVDDISSPAVAIVVACAATSSEPVAMRSEVELSWLDAAATWDDVLEI